MTTYSEHYFDAPLLQGEEGQTHRIHYLSWGDKSKPALFCVHGLTRNAHDFDYIAERLSAYYWVICPSMAGRGESEYLSDIRNYNYVAYMADCIELAAHLGIEKCDWIGTSMGGIIGMMVAALHSPLMGKLVMNDIGYIVPKDALAHICNYAANPPTFETYEAAREHLQTIQAGFGLETQAQWDHFARYSLIEDDGAWRMNYDPLILEPVRVETDNFKNLQDIDLTELWQPVACPILLLRGVKSEVLPVETAAMMRQDKELLSFAEIPNCAHAPHLMNDEQVKLIQDWLLAGSA